MLRIIKHFYAQHSRTGVGLMILFLLLACDQRPGPPPDLKPAGPPSELVLQVKAIKATRAPLTLSTVRTGFLEPAFATRIAPETSGTIAFRGISDGQKVRAGEVLFRIESGRQRLALAGATNAVDAAEVELAFLKQDFVRMQTLFKRKAASQRQFDTAELGWRRGQAQLAQTKITVAKAKRALADTTIKTPHAGVVHGRQVDVGDQVAPGRPLLEVVDLSRVRLRVGVSGASAARLQAGSEASLVISDLGGLTLSARLLAVAPKSDPRTGLFEVIYEATPPPESAVRGGMVAQVQVEAYSAKALLVPRSALVREGGSPALFVANADRAQKRIVRLGESDANFVAIESGLSEGEEVIVTGLHALADGVKIALKREPFPVPAPGTSLAEAAATVDKGTAPRP